MSRALEEHWGLACARLRYVPVGFGDHHWVAVDRSGRRWFVTVAGLDGGWRGTAPAAEFADLRAAMDTVLAVAKAGLEFAVAPVPTAGLALPERDLWAVADAGSGAADRYAALTGHRPSATALRLYRIR